ncbi:kunitz-type protease inhibitor 1-like [Melanotaenia boesemani]|uniref:kunitz-type protease inhibitor 1-like n=1 Tax=Melanotaenia boesemani TaxID=1250792 RepID=UPI001C05B3DB|nr:kunitz-type protease inhibitor 1-like [Melanotaenia boesemani]
MRQSSFLSSSSVLLLLLLLTHHGAAAEDVDKCSDTFRRGDGDFVLDTEEAVRYGATLLTTLHVPTVEDCEQLCCGDPKCNLALLEPRAATGDRTCVMFDCIYRNRFVCRFVNQDGYQSFIRDTVFQKYLKGPGKKAPPIANAGRDVIVQPGQVVTLNGIESLALDDRKITNYKWSLQSGNDSVKMAKTDLPDQVELSNLQPGSYIFKLTVTDSKDQTGDAKVRVLVLSQELSSLYCLAPLKVGPCRAAFPRWHYNVEAGSCEQFTFGGCTPNKNNYLSEKECKAACTGITVSSQRSISLPAAEVCGVECDPDQLICGNGCCLDRSLECDGTTHCSDGSDEDHCNKLNQTFNQLLSIDVNQRKARCTDLPVTGPCRASFTRWYYDPLNRKCHRFTYGGCDGNENNFEEDGACSEACKGVTEKNVYSRGMFDRYETDDPADDSGNVTLAVLLSVAILVLLAITAYCFMRARKERSQNSVSTRPAHVALSEQETLVYNSTTKPV